MDDTHCISLLKEWHDFCCKECVLHNDARTYFRNWNYRLAIPAILLSTIGGTANIGMSNNQCSSNNEQWLPILFGSLGLVSAALMTIHRYTNLAEVQKDNDFFSDEYAKLANEIKMQLFIFNGEHRTFTSLTEFCKRCKSLLDVLIDKAPPVPAFIVKKYEKKELIDKTLDEVLKKQNAPKRKTRNTSYIPSLLLFNNNKNNDVTRHPTVSHEIEEVLKSCSDTTSV